MTFQSYDLQDNEPRVPIVEDTLSISTGVGAFFPGEVAICLSYRGALFSGINPARRRGRIFLGPLDADVAELLSGDMGVTSATRGAIATAADAIVTAGLTADAQWCVFSPTTAGPAPWSEGVLTAASTPTVAGYVDNAFDTVRSRGAIATLRTVFP